MQSQHVILLNQCFSLPLPSHGGVAFGKVTRYFASESVEAVRQRPVVEESSRGGP